MNNGKIVQMASPEELLQNPADPIIKSFLGKHMDTGNTNGTSELLAEDVMKTKVLKVTKGSRTLECIELMKRRDVNSLVVLNDDDTYAGTVTIEDIKEFGKAGKEIRELVKTDVITISRKENAQIAFDQLLSTKANYVIVLNDDQSVAGLITKTSMAKALGEALWGELIS